MADAKKATKIRGVHRSSATRLISQVTSLWKTDISAIDCHQIDTIHRKLENIQSILMKADEQVQELITEDEVEEDCERSNEIQETILDALSQLATMRASVVSIEVPAHTTPADQSAVNLNGHAKMPKLQIRKFDGDPIAWQPFWDSFDSAVHSRTNISLIDKFNYLLSFLTDDALRVIEGFRITEANYQPVIDTLTERFGDKELAIFAHFDNLLALPCATMDTSSLQTTYDETEKHIRSLVALGLEEETFGRVFTPIILSKLPRSVRTELHRQNKSITWTVSNLRDLLHNEIKARQLGEMSLEQQKQPTQNRTTQKPDRNKPTYTIQNLTQNSKQLPICAFCDQQHYSAACRKVQTKSARQSIARQKQLCFKCLSKTHMVKECRSTKPCFYCKSTTHHCSLCAAQFPDSPQKSKWKQKELQSPQSSKASISKNSNQTLSATAYPGPTATFTIMQTALVKFGHFDTSAHLYFDCGSSRSYITSSLARRLNLPLQDKETISSATFEATQRRSRTYPTAIIHIPTIEDEIVEVAVLVTDAISCPIQRFPLDKAKYPILCKIPLADPPPDTAESVTLDILIGADYYFKLVKKERIDLDEDIVLLDSKLGYIITGQCHYDENLEENSFANTVTMFHNFSLSYQNQDIEKLWSMEEIGVKENYQQSDDDLAVHQFNNSIKLHKGRYETGWPWREGCEDLRTNRSLALRRLRSLIKRLKSDPKLLNTYTTTINNQLDSQIIETVPEISRPTRIHYLPHHPVCRPDKATTKIRIVFDASSKEQKDHLALNECLLRGPVFLQDLCSLLLRFRITRYAVTADIEKAFLQVGLREQDRDVTRFLWVKDTSLPVTEENLLEYRFCRVLFGIISSPFLLDATIKHHLRLQNTPVAHQIAENIYVDNVIGGNDTEDQCIEFYNEARHLFSMISMNIREWYTNSAKTRQYIPQEHQGQSGNPKVLGMQWNTDKDTIGCAPIFLQRTEVNMKKHLVQAVSRLFDPCGLFSPITVEVKALVQSLWKLQLKWDDRLPDDIKAQWEKHKLELQLVETATIERFVPLSHNRELSPTAEVHVFCDASVKAYAAAVYLKAVDGSTHLMFSKTRLAPLKQLSLPRLELMAVLLGARISSFVKRSLGLLGLRTTLWSDSKCSLYWLQSPKVLATFVSNRVREIHRHQIDCFLHIPSELNPADIPSRGSTFQDLSANRLWWKGPDFLVQPTQNWPSKQFNKDSEEPSNIEVMEELALQISEAPFTGPVDLDIDKYSSMRRLLRITGYILRFINAARRKHSYTSQLLTAEEIEEAQKIWVKRCQHWYKSTTEQGSQITLKRQLGLFADADDIVRCRGRLGFSTLPYETKYPAFLPRQLRFTSLLILDVHQSIHHRGVSHTLSEVRKPFWIPHGRAEVKKTLSRCLVCRRWEGKAYATPERAPLPPCRVDRVRPFQQVGIDYMGPLFVKGPEDSSKRWICLVTCTSTRAIHLELLATMTADAFLLALRRFIALCAKPDVIISDNARQFKTANRTLQEVWHGVINDPTVTHRSTTYGITWKFIPEYSPWMGGFYERLVADVKSALKKTIGTLKITHEELQTLIYEIAWVINTRPLIPPGDINDPVLTPADLLGRIPSPGIPYVRKSEEDTYENDRPGLSQCLSERWTSLTQSLDHFWNVWQTIYLTSLRERSIKVHNFNTSQEEPTVGTTVLIKTTSSRCNWQIARITKLNKSKDGKVRSVMLRLPNRKTTTRPVSMLYPLEIDKEGESFQTKNVVTREARPKRKAAVVARQRITDCAVSEGSE